MEITEKELRGRSEDTLIRFIGALQARLKLQEEKEDATKDRRTENETEPDTV